MDAEEFYQEQKSEEGILVTIKQNINEALYNALKYFIPWFVFSLPILLMFLSGDHPQEVGLFYGISFAVLFFLGPICVPVAALYLISWLRVKASRPEHSRLLRKSDSIVLLEKNKSKYPDVLSFVDIHEISWGGGGQAGSSAPVHSSTVVFAGPPAVAAGMVAGQVAVAGFLGLAGFLGKRMNKRVHEVGVKVKDQYVVLAKGLTQGQAEYVFVKLKNLIEGF
jgi:hypothetical protein